MPVMPPPPRTSARLLTHRRRPGHRCRSLPSSAAVHGGNLAVAPTARRAAQVGRQLSAATIDPWTAPRAPSTPSACTGSSSAGGAGHCRSSCLYQLDLKRRRLGRTLDVGCGSDRNLGSLAAGPVGVDHIPTWWRWREPPVTRRTPSRSAAQQPAPFDALLFAHVLEHLVWDDAVRLVRDYLAHLRPGGTVLFVCPQERGYDSDPTHLQFLDGPDLQRLARERRAAPATGGPSRSRAGQGPSSPTTAPRPVPGSRPPVTLAVVQPQPGHAHPSRATRRVHPVERGEVGAGSSGDLLDGRHADDRQCAGGGRADAAGQRGALLAGRPLAAGGRRGRAPPPRAGTAGSRWPATPSAPSPSACGCRASTPGSPAQLAASSGARTRGAVDDLQARPRPGPHRRRPVEAVEPGPDLLDLGGEGTCSRNVSRGPHPRRQPDPEQRPSPRQLRPAQRPQRLAPARRASSARSAERTCSTDVTSTRPTAGPQPGADLHPGPVPAAEGRSISPRSMAVSSTGRIIMGQSHPSRSGLRPRPALSSLPRSRTRRPRPEVAVQRRLTRSAAPSTTLTPGLAGLRGTSGCRLRGDVLAASRSRVPRAAGDGLRLVAGLPPFAGLVGGAGRPSSTPSSAARVSSPSARSRPRRC